MKVSVLRRGVRPAALTGALVLSLVACAAGQTTTEERATPTASPHATATTPSERSTPSKPAEPSSISLRRIGGIAGFQDVLIVDRAGGATFTSRARQRVTCTVNPKVKSQLDTVAATAAEAPGPGGKGGLKNRKTYPDAMHLYITVGDREVRFEDLGSDGGAYRRLFSLMNSVMAAAESIRAGKKPAAGSACSA